MKATQKPPVKVSTDLIRAYYYVGFDHGKEPNSGIVVDDASYELMFVKEKNVKFVNELNKGFTLPPAYTLIHPKPPFRFEFPDTFTTFCIKLQPWMNASYIPTQKAEAVINLNTLYADPIDQLQQELFEVETMDEKIELAEQFLLSLPIQMNKETELIKNICNLIYEKSGNITVNEISETFNIYRQKLNQLFKQEVKYTLKVFINCIRIRACLSYKIKNPTISLTEIGMLYGYYDQAHFIRSFKNATGVSPSEYVKNPGYSFTTLLHQK